MGAIFVSYRRSDSQGEAGRVFDDLVSEFGENLVFMDVAGIEAGRDFRKVIEESVAKCSILLVVMGPEWLNAKNENGTRRLDDPLDFVRIETAAALRRDIPVVPVLVRGAKMPHPDQLPDVLKDLAYRNCCELTHARWRSDIQLLIGALRRLVGDAGIGGARTLPKPASRSPRVRMAQNRGIEAELDLGASAEIDPAILQRISRELAVHIGPIADVVVRRTATRCASAEDVWLEAAGEIESREEREEFLLKRGQIFSTAIPKLEQSRTQLPNTSRELVWPRAQEEGVQSEEVPSASADSRQHSSRWPSISLVSGAVALVLLIIALAPHFLAPKARPSSQGKQPPVQGTGSSAGDNKLVSDVVGGPQDSKPGQIANNNVQMKPTIFKPAGSQRYRVPPEVSSSLVIRRVLPNYPQTAQDARVQGTVVLEAAISKAGTIEEIREVSGHPLLVPAAIDAVKQWQYKPLVLNGKPVDMQTLITVNFTLKNP